MPVSDLKTLCVFCGSATGTNPAYLRDAEALGAALVKNDINLVYGGGNRGLMGAVAKSVHQAGGKVTGFIPETMTQFEGLLDVGEMILVPDMHTRKQRMASSCDGFIALAGGFGTFEELLEMITWSQLRLHDKPIAVLNTDGFYNPLLALIDRAVADGFIRKENKGLLIVSDTVEELLQALKDFKMPENGRYDLDWNKPAAVSS